jgi:alkylation response protein AidB-like acyl-CoA dehydrogenase
VASSDATNISIKIEREGDEYVINGRKWWITGAGSLHCKIMVLMGKTNPEVLASPYPPSQIASRRCHQCATLS